MTMQTEKTETLFDAAAPPPGPRPAAERRRAWRLPALRPRLFPRREAAVEVARSRLFVTGCAFFVAFGVVTAKLVDASLYDPARQVRIDPGRAALEAPEPRQLRADIVDRNGELIATSLPVASLCARPKLIRDPAAAAFLVAGVLPHMSAAAIQAELERGKDYVWLRRHITPKQHQALIGLGLPGLCFEREQRRVYPQAGLASHIAGFADLDGRGLAGVERAFNTVLDERAESLTLSIDLRVQRILREEVAYAMERFQAIGGVGVMMDVETAEVVGMISLPDFDPNDAGAAADDARFDRAMLGVYEMGSTFKLMTAAQALESGAADMSTRVDATKPLRIGRYTIRDFHAENRWLSLSEVLIHSSNVGAARIAELSGPAAQRAFLGSLGLLTTSGIELEELGAPLAPRRWADVHMLTIAFGHGLAVTPLHLTTAVSALVNGGVFRQPTILKRLDGEEPKGERVISEKVSQNMRRLMRLVASEGTGRKADVDAYPVGGKTGTAEKAAGRRGYNRNARLASFIAAFPIQRPKYVLLVMVDEPKPRKDTYGYATGGWVAAPAVKRIIERSAPLLGLAPLPADSKDWLGPVLRDTSPASGKAT